MTPREVVESFWEAMRANDWDAAAEHFAADALIEWPCTGERIKSPAAWAEMQARYPAAGRWSFDVHWLIADDSAAVSECTVTDGEHPARVVAISQVEGDRIVRQIEYWTVAYEPADWRADLVERIEPVP
jgi:limonene-1,2-epoxide hydrolase